jgi:hypothetical protein
MNHGPCREPGLNSYITMFDDVLLGPNSFMGKLKFVSHVDWLLLRSKLVEILHEYLHVISLLLALLETENSFPTRGVSPTYDPGRSNKRKKSKKSSDVWDYFTKIFIRDLEGNVMTLAACNHCSKVLTGNSTHGTSHLADHTCSCKFKPVQAGRKDKGVVNVLSSQASSSRY